VYINQSQRVIFLCAYTNYARTGEWKIRLTYTEGRALNSSFCLYNSLRLFFQVVECLTFGTRRDKMAKAWLPVNKNLKLGMIIRLVIDWFL